MRIAIAGLGAVGKTVARKLADGLPGLTLAAIAVRDHDKALAWLKQEGITCPLASLDELPAVSDVVVECAPPALLDQIVTPMLRAGKQVMVLSASALLPRADLVDLARATGGRIIVPTGALVGFDAVSAAAQGSIETVEIVTRKPPKGLAGAPYLVENAIRIDGITAPLCVFKGNARQAAVAFPANVNVIAALSLAGIGPERTQVEVWADPTLTRNCHQIRVVADSASFSMTMENIPSENPATGRITALSVIAALRRLTSPLVIGT
ncbi:aspartate dehydrogenase [Methylocella sp. CPCC 101449]|uniref:aspartate dehydrogenase n=1 Tax=Methylocella sp. CPCC 101449 TaxID=2987531 RepID=UPI0028910345|nr:aspartate dehydrogenase [Methylocella sp. CPCC 101449]MDT2023887.1 aspartate dehydrogenase [Methylocella sp. CPCC 101449]